MDDSSAVRQTEDRHSS